MTLDQIDHLLAQWQGKLDMAAQNLVDLRSHPTYQRLASGPELSGVTLARVEPMLASMLHLFEFYDRLQACLALAQEARKGVTRLFPSPEKMDEVARILTTPSIAMAAVDVPLAQRDLLSPKNTEMRISPEELLIKLTQDYGAAKALVLSVDSAWRQVGSELDAVERDGQGLQSRIAAARRLAASDPLGAQAESDALTRMVAERLRLREDLKNATQTLSTISAFHVQADRFFDEANRKIQKPAVLSPCRPEAISALEQWLQTLRTKLDEGAWDAVEAGLGQWTQKATACLQSEMEAAEANQRPVLHRRELRGRLDALKAKAVAKGKAEDAELLKLAKQARDMLQTDPTSLDQAGQMVREYEKRLSFLL